ncbi:MAG: hypothetical protein PHW92_06385 [Lutibacter sp.]|nr:hypothetical protein [Lutibacter sp.]
MALYQTSVLKNYLNRQDKLVVVAVIELKGTKAKDLEFIHKQAFNYKADLMLSLNKKLQKVSQKFQLRKLRLFKTANILILKKINIWKEDEIKKLVTPKPSKYGSKNKLNESG